MTPQDIRESTEKLFQIRQSGPSKLEVTTAISNAVRTVTSSIRLTLTDLGHDCEETAYWDSAILNTVLVKQREVLTEAIRRLQASSALLHMDNTGRRAGLRLAIEHLQVLLVE